jgi:hypothetical protein
VTDERNTELTLTDDDRQTLRYHGVDLAGIELDPVEGAHGYHVGAWIDDTPELEFMVTPDAPVEQIVETLFESMLRNASMVDKGIGVAVAAVEVEVADGEPVFGRDDIARRDGVSGG